MQSLYESYVVVISCCLKGTAVSKNRQVSSLHCHPRWHHVKHCVENCLHCGWAENVLSWCTLLQKMENEFQCCWTKYGMTYTAMWGLYVAETADKFLNTVDEGLSLCSFREGLSSHFFLVSTVALSFFIKTWILVLLLKVWCLHWSAKFYIKEQKFYSCYCFCLFPHHSSQ